MAAKRDPNIQEPKSPSNSKSSQALTGSTADDRGEEEEEGAPTQILLSLLTEPKQNRAIATIPSSTAVPPVSASPKPNVTSQAASRSSHDNRNVTSEGALVSSSVGVGGGGGGRGGGDTAGGKHRNKCNNPSSSQTHSPVSSSNNNTSQGGAAHSVLLQLLQERKAKLGANSNGQSPASSSTGPSNSADISSAEPIVIMPSSNGTSRDNGNDVIIEEDALYREQTPEKKSKKTKVISSPLSNSITGSVTSRDAQKLEDHMQVGSGPDLIEDLELNAVDNDSVDKCSVKTLSPAPSSGSNTPSTSNKNDTSRLRRSKRKRMPARSKYYDKDFLRNEDDLGDDIDDEASMVQTVQPKILCVEGSGGGHLSGSEKSESSTTISSATRAKYSHLSSMLEGSSDIKYKPASTTSSADGVDGVMGAGDTGLHSAGDDRGSSGSIISVGGGGSDSVRRGTNQSSADMEELVSYRCSHCFVYFSNREEVRVHLRKEHNILTFKNSPRLPSFPSSSNNSTRSSCKDCGCHSGRSSSSNIKQQDSTTTTTISSPSSKRCVVCGKSESTATVSASSSAIASMNNKSFINIFRQRTWSNRHHQLAHRLSQALGCKFSLATCRSRLICPGCVAKLESIEKASMQLRQMVKGIKRTNLVSGATQVHLKGTAKRMLKSGSMAVKKSSSSSRCSSTAPEEVEGSTGGGNNNLPASAPLVRELLAAPEVLIPQSQFSELLGALGGAGGGGSQQVQPQEAAPLDCSSGGGGGGGGASVSHHGLAALLANNSLPKDSRSNSNSSGGRKGSGMERRTPAGSAGAHQKQARNLATVQHDDVAFDEFVKELRAQQQQRQHPSIHIMPHGVGSSGVRPFPFSSSLEEHHPGLGGRVLAEVRVKQEPIDIIQEYSEDLSLQPSRGSDGGSSGSGLGSNNHQQHDSAVLQRVDNRGEQYESLDVNGEPVVEDLTSLYTTMQIDSRSGQTEYACSLCNHSFYSEAAIQLHVKCHMLGSRDLQCFLCGYHNALLPSQWRIMKRHLETEHEFPEIYFHRFPCPVRGCAELFKCQKDMTAHVGKVHRTPVRLAREHALADVGLFNFPCHLCGTLLQSDAALQIHVLCHNNSAKHYQCCFCGYMHSSQPGSWRIMRGHLTKEHVDKELPPDIFSYHECPYYACRLKFCSKKAQIVHRACHDETKDGEFFCFQCHFSVPATPYLWENVRDHIIAKHPEAVGESFRCTCKARFDSYKAFLHHINEVQSNSNSSSSSKH